MVHVFTQVNIKSDFTVNTDPRGARGVLGYRIITCFAYTAAMIQAPNSQLINIYMFRVVRTNRIIFAPS